MERPRAVITGIGIASPIGTGMDKFWIAALRGDRGIRSLTGFDTSGWPVTFGGEVRDINVSDWIPRKDVRKMSRSAILSVIAARLAVNDSGISITEDNCRDIDIVMGNTCFDGDYFGESVMRRKKLGVGSADPFIPAVTVLANATGNISITLGIKGETSTICTACSSGMNAIGYAQRKIRNEGRTLIFAGGADIGIQQDLIASYARAGILSQRNDAPEEACRPFEANRDGHVLSEASAVVIVEEYEHAKKRDAKIYAEIAGYATCSEAHSMAEVLHDETDSVRCISNALKDAGKNPEDVDYYCAHGSSSRVTDARETRMLKRSLGRHAYRVPVTGLKGMIGHSFAASGAIQAATCAKAISSNELPPTVNYRNPDPECDLDYVPNEARQQRVDCAMTYSLGMGNNAALVLSAC